MAYTYTEGEKKIRPGIYHRYSNNDNSANTAGAINGVVALVMGATWGPTGTVTAHSSVKSVENAYGSGAALDVVKKLFEGGTQTVLIYRPAGSTAGAKATATLDSVTITAKHEGTRATKVKVQVKPSDATKKQLLVLSGSTLLETFEFDVNETDEATGLIAAVASSNQIDAALTAAGTAGVIAEAEVALTGGKDPVLTVEDYTAGFYALEPYNYNVLVTDTLETNSVLAEYVEEAYENGKLAMAVMGCDTTTAFETMKSNAKALNSEKIVYLGGGYVDEDGNEVDGAQAVAYAAGAIAGTAASRSIVHQAVNGASDVIKTYTNEEYIEAIQNGLLLLSVGPDGTVWFDSGINTLTAPKETQDDGWKKIRRVKTRYELMDRIDRTLAPKVGNINCNSDGVAYVIQTAMGVIKEMIAEGKITSGTFYEDPENPHEGDSAWFLIEVDDLDSLEKIYLHYKFRYSTNS